ncbi:hypothetical protein [Kibdelosporangium phytohabitans]|uniref:Uncharacterized protein n=1 Tax=Kibdelosporangium phytohabitans TaxID=860235 RepID=A0A0N7F2Q4_9PSEU|nr:hypothetical protein [Kibdelosporangium phytohabitans]ALG06479.1 hypothetical protein AOZ06_05645 [Kibdelosporangium phytohabitans]MBE1467650.1 beta-lactamase class A [Kibdelosporangium phytohabitans]
MCNGVGEAGLDAVQRIAAELDLSGTRIIGGTADVAATLMRETGMQVWSHRSAPGSRSAMSGCQAGPAPSARSATRSRSSNTPVRSPIAVAVFTFAARADLALPAVDAAIAEAARLAVTDLRSGRL